MKHICVIIRHSFIIGCQLTKDVILVRVEVGLSLTTWSRVIYEKLPIHMSEISCYCVTPGFIIFAILGSYNELVQTLRIAIN
jgi:hypothetical protein